MRALSTILLLIVAFGCDGSKKREAPAAPAKAEADEVTEVRASTPAPPLFERHAAPEPALDPSQVPVEEDFIGDAERRIGKSAKLEVELARLKQEIQSDSR